VAGLSDIKSIHLISNSYFVLSTIFQFIVTFVDQDKIATTLPVNVSLDQTENDNLNLPLDRERNLQSSPSEQLFQNSKSGTLSSSTTKMLPIEQLVCSKDSHSYFHLSLGKLYVGKYFTEEGEFYSVGFSEDIKKLLKLYQQKKYSEVEFNHKSKSKAD
jgi:hypothetical protein